MLVRILDPPLADAILDRIIHNAQRIQFVGANLNEKSERNGVCLPFRVQSEHQLSPPARCTASTV